MQKQYEAADRDHQCLPSPLEAEPHLERSGFCTAFLQIILFVHMETALRTIISEDKTEIQFKIALELQTNKPNFKKKQNKKPTGLSQHNHIQKSFGGTPIPPNFCSGLGTPNPCQMLDAFLECCYISFRIRCLKKALLPFVSSALTHRS